MLFRLAKLVVNEDQNTYKYTVRETDGVDREGNESKPNTAGFYHFPADADPFAAVETLHYAMVKDIQSQIARLHATLNSLHAANVAFQSKKPK